MTTAQQLSRASQKAREWTVRRNALIRQMDSEGASQRAIGDAAGLTHTGVAKILAR